MQCHLFIEDTATHVERCCWGRGAAEGNADAGASRQRGWKGGGQQGTSGAEDGAWLGPLDGQGTCRPRLD